MRTHVSCAQHSLLRPITTLIMLASVAGCVPTIPDPVEMADDQTGPASGQDVTPAVVSITISVDTDGGGGVEQDPSGGFVTLTATPDAGMEFIGWTGTTASLQNPLTILASESTFLTAHFSEPMVDSDLDGVADQHDTCPNTSRGEPVQETGCSCSQLDDDGDGVINCDDTCPQTASAQEVDDDGCACDQRDQDGDGVLDCDDICSFTIGADGAVDAHGCGLRQRDTDDDGVNDFKDECPDTPEQAVVNSKGCLPVCGDSKVEADEACDPPDGIDCDDTCKRLPSVCGNGIVQTGEDCDPPNSTNCNTFCQSVVFCGDGVVEGGEECDPPSGNTCDDNCRSINNANCGNFVIDSGEECDPPNGFTCDDNCRLIGGAVCGNLVIEGGEECDPPEDGICDENCQDIGSTGCGAGSCFGAHAGPGCNDQACCDIVCCVDPFCCDVEWTQECADTTALVCQTGVGCSGGTGDCLTPNGTPGCADEPCCNAVCNFDPTCCTVSWGPQCRNIAFAIAFQFLGCVCGN